MYPSPVSPDNSELATSLRAEKRCELYQIVHKGGAGRAILRELVRGRGGVGARRILGLPSVCVVGWMPVKGDREIVLTVSGHVEAAETVDEHGWSMLDRQFAPVAAPRGERSSG